jgi:hypothetical protein
MDEKRPLWCRPRGSQSTSSGTPPGPNAQIARQRAWAARRVTCVRGFVALLAATVFVGSAAVSPAAASYPGQNGKVVDVTGVLYEFNGLKATDALGSQWLTQTQSRESDPAWSPDGQRVVWVRDFQQLWVMNADGSEQCEFFSDPAAGGFLQIASPSWSPDGAKAVFARQNDVYVVAVPSAGTCPAAPVDPADAQHIAGPFFTDHFGSGPTWSPKGDRLAFHWVGFGDQGGIGLMNPDGTGFQAITTYPGDGEPDWSPSGNTLVFTHGYSIDGKGTSSISTIAPTLGAERTDIVAGMAPDSCGAQGNTRPHWSPDGTMIAYYQVYCNGSYIAVREGVAAPDGTDLGTLLSGVASWQPCFANCHPLMPAASDTDTDGDGIPDIQDACPTQPGPASNNGCPVTPPADSDGDGLPDATDACPTQPGPSTNNGCPVEMIPTDGDGDGVPDATDGCPTTPGPSSNYGCPIGTTPTDSDGDGVPDTTDSCPQQSGPSSNAGCPIGVAPSDGDGDGIPDAIDSCPAQAGGANNSGCPQADTAVSAAMQRFRPHLRFDSDERFRPLDVEAIIAADRPWLCKWDPDTNCSGATAPRINAATQLRGTRVGQEFSGHEPEDFDWPTSFLALRDPGLGYWKHNGDFYDPDGWLDGPARQVLYTRESTNADERFLDYWAFYRFNDSSHVPEPERAWFDRHQSDWEGMTVAVPCTKRGIRVPCGTAGQDVPQSFDFVGFASHYNVWMYTKGVIVCADGGLHWCGALDQRPVGYVANGTHATYSRPCALACAQTDAYLVGVPILEAHHDGRVPWQRNDDAGDLVSFPSARTSWTYWAGNWNTDAEVFGPLYRDHNTLYSPGHQHRFLKPWDPVCTPAPNSPADCWQFFSSGPAVLSATSADTTCGPWFGPSVVAMACDPAAVKADLAGQPSAGAPVVQAAGHVDDSAAGVAQMVGAPLKPGSRVRVEGTGRSLNIALRGRDAKGAFNAVFNHVVLPRGGTGSLRVSVHGVTLRGKHIKPRRARVTRPHTKRKKSKRHRAMHG